MKIDHTASLVDLCRRYWVFLCDEYPHTAIMASQSVAHDDMLRCAPADHERRAAFARAMLVELNAVAPEPLSAQDRASRTALARELYGLIDSVALQAHLRPSLYPLGPEFLPTYVAGLTALANVADARRWLARLRRIPAGLQGVTDALAAGITAGLRYPRMVLECASAQTLATAGIAARDSAYYGPFARAGERGVAFAAVAQEALRAIEDEVYPALQAYAGFVRERLGAVARDSLACIDDLQGAPLYQHLIRQHTTLDISAEEVHRIGLAEVERIAAQMRSVAECAGFAGDLVGYMQKLQTDPERFAASGQALREQIEVLSKRIEAKLPQFFGHLPRSTYGVQLIPEALAEKMPPAYAQPNPADNSACGVHWVTSLPQKCPRYMHLPLALHEGWPGHLMHIALMQEIDALPDFRRYGAMGYTACLEGWALYCERLGEEMGLYDTPDKLYGRLEMEMWRALRLVVDTGLHAKGWSRKQSIDLMVRHLTMPRVTIEAEVDRYIGMPGQALAYQIGNRKFCELRERAEARLGERFDRRAFHDALMAAGPVTLDALDEYIQSWIDVREAPAPALGA